MRFLILQRCADETSAISRERMHHYARVLASAGVLLAAGQPVPGVGVRIGVLSGKRIVVAATGPGGPITAFWIIDVRSEAEAVEWAQRAPLTDRHTLDVLPIREPATPAPIRKAST